MSELTDKFLAEIKDESKGGYPLLSKFFEDKYRNDIDFIIGLGAIPAKLMIYTLNRKVPSKFNPMKAGQSFEERWFSGCPGIVEGSLTPFTRQDEYAEIAFEPLKTFNLVYDDIKKVGDEDPLLWVQLELNIDGEWVKMILHEYAEPIEFSANHQIMIEPLESTNFEGLSVSMFDPEGAGNIDAVLN